MKGSSKKLIVSNGTRMVEKCAQLLFQSTLTPFSPYLLRIYL